MYGGQTVPTIIGGGNYNAGLGFGSSNVSMTFFSSSIQNWKPTQFKAPVQITGSLNVTGSVNITGQYLVNGVPIGGTINTGSFATTGSNTFTGLNTFNNGIKIQTNTPSDSFSQMAFVNNQSLQIATTATSTGIGSQSGSFIIMSMTTGSAGNASFQMTAQISGTIGQLAVSNNAGTSSIKGEADNILFAKKEGFPNIPATTFTAEATTINLKGAVNVSGSLTVQSGSSFFANGNKQFNVGTFISNVTQSGSANVSQSMNFEVTDISSGVSIASNSRITLANSGTYNIQFSAQVLADTGADTVWIWLKKNGTNVSSTSTKLVLANNEANVAAWNFVVDAAANDYFELVWQSSGGHTKLLTEAASGNYPAIPSIILTVTQVR
jgi:hypothetical protein